MCNFQRKKLVSVVRRFIVLSMVLCSAYVPRAQAGPGAGSAEKSEDLQTCKVVIHRKARRLELFETPGAKPCFTCPIDIGSGGLRAKKSMADEVTPTGLFHVDLILSKDSRYNAIADSSRKRFVHDKSLAGYVDGPGALERLYNNMSSMDFDHDGKADRAYGDAYIGLDASAPNVVSGPKLTRYKGKPYWFSIAIHGTPDGKIGVPSGGCVHVDAQAIPVLLNKVRVGTLVCIRE